MLSLLIYPVYNESNICNKSNICSESESESETGARVRHMGESGVNAC